jgi:hypothetical protein
VAGTGDYVIDRLVPSLDMANVVLAAFAGSGKTTLSLEAAVSMALAMPLWRSLRIPNRLRVLYVDQERAEGQIRDTINRLSEVYGKPPEDSLVPISRKSGGSFSIRDKESLDELRRQLDAVRPDFVFFDGWQWFVDGMVSDFELVSKGIAFWKGIRAEYRCGLWIVHHTKKIGAPTSKPKNPLELATGCQQLMDQAKTKLVYQNILSRDDLGYLYGTTPIPEWNPVRMLLEYEMGPSCHWLVLEQEAGMYLSAEEFREVYGRPKGGGRDARELAELRHLMGNPSMERLASIFGVSKMTVSRWARGEDSMRWRHRETLDSLLIEWRLKRGAKPKRLQGQD